MRADFLEERREAMTAWAKWLGFDPDIDGDRVVVPLRQA